MRKSRATGSVSRTAAGDSAGRASLTTADRCRPARAWLGNGGDDSGVGIGSAAATTAGSGVGSRRKLNGSGRGRALGHVADRLGGGLADRFRLVKREANWLARIAGRRLDADQRGDLVRGTGRLGQRHPLLDAGVELVGGNVLRGDDLGLVPIAGKGMGQREILAGARVGANLAGGRLEHGDRALRIAGERQRQADIGRVEHALRLGQQRLGFVVLALGDLRPARA